MVMEPDETSDDLARMVLDAALEVHRHLGPAFVESVYETRSATSCRCAVRVSKGRSRSASYIRKCLSVKAVPIWWWASASSWSSKALPALAPAHLAQVISYLKAMGLTLGLLVNFGERHLKTGCRRVVLTLQSHISWRLGGLAALLLRSPPSQMKMLAPAGPLFSMESRY
jgi:hypothetical protein